MIFSIRPRHGSFRSFLCLVSIVISFESGKGFFITHNTQPLHRRGTQERETGTSTADEHLFSQLSTKNFAREETKLFGINEWRDTVFNDLPDGSPALRVGVTKDDRMPREVCVLPFPYEDVLLQGETKQLRLYEDRFVQLFEKAMNDHSGLVAMGLIADSGIIQTVPLCEIEAYNRVEGFGIFVSIRVIGRAGLLEITQQEPFITAVCVEINDTVPPNLELPNMVASTIENFMITLSNLDHKLEQNALKQKAVEEATDAAGPDIEMKRRITEAQLEDTFYFDSSSADEEDDDDEGEDYAEPKDINEQFQRAYDASLLSDSQGYMVSSSSEASCERSVQELTAMSWAAFSIDEADVTQRIQALDCDDLFDRLKLAAFMLRDFKSELEAKVALDGINTRFDDSDSMKDGED
mmetsp:Transcript_24501/g.35864  ORF Transcript_24501/g.35864 Transcript_24501/m.35864 type:complete len:409 (-) Transcript_24501:112-1338(-)|eukprot:CAMPEP_0195523858 /NCGR_PEP_ID=MMETSP0794_2-20130614/23320_1 /TAXON_ID=515487 /ORGANISM="Stephanopyxis turris, Strain CCMP 815" /LENGTH=408 /DNA_ID=CAMNT_0040653947 /DNA_START=11 /DNA_END=1237 /DNA_ORIENTATION=+